MASQRTKKRAFLSLRRRKSGLVNIAALWSPRPTFTWVRAWAAAPGTRRAARARRGRIRIRVISARNASRPRSTRWASARRQRQRATTGAQDREALGGEEAHGQPAGEHGGPRDVEGEDEVGLRLGGGPDALE